MLVLLGFRILNGGAKSRHKSAVVLVVLLALLGGVFSSLFGFIASAILTSPIMVVTKFLSNFLPISSVEVINIFYASGPALSAGFFASFFGLPLSRIAIGEKVIRSWSQPSHQRLGLFWRASLGSLVIHLVALGTAVRLFDRMTPALDSDFGSGTLLRSPYRLTAEHWLMEEVFISLFFMAAVMSFGLIVFLSEKQRKADFRE